MLDKEIDMQNRYKKLKCDANKYTGIITKLEQKKIDLEKVAAQEPLHLKESFIEEKKKSLLLSENIFKFEAKLMAVSISHIASLRNHSKKLEQLVELKGLMIESKYLL